MNSEMWGTREGQNELDICFAKRVPEATVLTNALVFYVMGITENGLDIRLKKWDLSFD